jgi:hypothetical protein
MNLKDLHPAKLFSMVEVIVAGVAAFLPLSGTQVAAICAIAAVATSPKTINPRRRPNQAQLLPESAYRHRYKCPLSLTSQHLRDDLCLISILRAHL